MCFPDDCTYVCLKFQALTNRTGVYASVFTSVRAAMQALRRDHATIYSQVLEYPALEAI